MRKLEQDYWRKHPRVSTENPVCFHRRYHSVRIQIKLGTAILELTIEAT